MDEPMIADGVNLAGGEGDLVESYYARPLRARSAPGVVVLHHSPGWDEITKDIVRRLAGYGYLAIAPNLYSREMNGRSTEDAAADIRSRGGVPTRLVQEDVGAAIDFIRLQEQSNGKVGILGYSFGGRQTFIAACTHAVDAAVVNYGGYVVSTLEELADKHPGEAHVAVPLDLASRIDCPVLGLYGAHDVNPSPEHVETIATELEALGKDFTYYSYENAGHGFATWNLPHYVVDAAVDAWSRMIGFFDQHLKP